MDSPVRKMQKRNDYNRHKLLRKIKRQRRAQVEQQKVAAEKELKRRLRVTPPKFGDGKEPTLLDVDKVRMNEQGLFQDEAGNIVGDSVVLPELTVRAHKGYKSAYDREMLDNTIGAALDFVPGIGDAKQGTEALDALNKGNYEEAAMLGGLLLLPNVIEKPLKYAGKGIRKAYDIIPENTKQDITRNYWRAKMHAKGLFNIANDISANPVRVVKDYMNGDYPITRGQQKAFIAKKNAEIQSWIDQALSLEREQLAKRLQYNQPVGRRNSTITFENMNDFFPQSYKVDGISTSRPTVSYLSKPSVGAPHGSEGEWDGYLKTIKFKNRNKQFSNFNNYRKNKGVFFHEFTHALQDNHYGNQPFLHLSKFDEHTGYYDFFINKYNNLNSNAFDKMIDRANSVNNEFIKAKLDPNYKISKPAIASVHSISPDEAIADWRECRLLYPDQSADILLGKQNALSKWFQKEYGLSVDDLIELHDFGYDKGKSPKIITKKK